MESLIFITREVGALNLSGRVQLGIGTMTVAMNNIPQAFHDNNCENYTPSHDKICTQKIPSPYPWQQFVKITHFLVTHPVNNSSLNKITEKKICLSSLPPDSLLSFGFQMIVRLMPKRINILGLYYLFLSLLSPSIFLISPEQPFKLA